MNEFSHYHPVAMRIFIFFILGLFFSVEARSQDNFLLLPDQSGMDRSVYEPALEAKASEVINYFEEVNIALDSNIFPLDFRVYDFGAYVHNTAQMDTSDILDISRGLANNQNRLLFNKLSDVKGVWSKIFVELSLNCSLDSCINIEYIENQVQIEFDVFYGGKPENYMLASMMAIDRLLYLLREGVCCYLNQESRGYERSSIGRSLECNSGLSEMVEHKIPGAFPIDVSEKFFNLNFVSETGAVVTFPGYPSNAIFQPNGTLHGFLIDDVFYRSCVYSANLEKFAGYRHNCKEGTNAYAFKEHWGIGDIAQVNVGNARENCVSHVYNLNYPVPFVDLARDGGVDSLVSHNFDWDYTLVPDRLDDQLGMDNFNDYNNILPYTYGDTNQYKVIDYTNNGLYPCPNKGAPEKMDLGPYSLDKDIVIRPDGTGGFWQLTYEGWVYYRWNEDGLSYDYWLYDPSGNYFMSFKPLGTKWEGDSFSMFTLLNEIKDKTGEVLLDVDTYIFVAGAVGVVSSAPVAIAAGLTEGLLYLYKGDYGNAILSAFIIGTELYIIYKAGKYFVKVSSDLFTVKKEANGLLKVGSITDDISPALKNFVEKYGFSSNEIAQSFHRDLISASPEFRQFIETFGDDGVKAWEFAFNCPTTIKTNTNVLEGLSAAIQRGIKPIDDVVSHANHPAITDKTVKHIFRGDSGGGRHHISAILNDDARKLVDRISETSEGFYGAVFSSGGRKSFWPDSWDEFRVMDELKYVMNNNPTNTSGNIWEGTTQGGQLINYYLHADGHVISAFPVLPNFP
ncbi:MAG: EndoU domain-containing protein [Lewinellaceae bacterium]|nr:EndoU domain-containing protein [Lewinellaceae bacterium]